MNVEPISPDDIAQFQKSNVFPDFVLSAFNFCIAKNYLNGKAEVKKDEVIEKIISDWTEHVKNPNVNLKIPHPTKESRLNGGQIPDTGKMRDLIISNSWLNVEDVYRAKGWKVFYDSPSYDENYAAHFIFSKRNN